MFDIYKIIDSLQYGKQFEKLCYRFLKNCHIKEDKQLPHPASITVTKKSVYISYNSISDFYKKESDMKFALLHEASHFLFGHIYIDITKYDMEKLNLVLDASINPYLLSDMDFKKVSPIKEYKNGTIVSGMDSILDKHTWEYMYNNFPDNNDVLEEKTQEQKEQENSNTQNKQEDSSNNTNENEEEQQNNETEQEDGDQDDSQNVSETETTEESDDTGGTEHISESGGSNQKSSNETDIFRNSEGMSERRNSDYKRKDYFIDEHTFLEQPSKAIEAQFKEIVLTAMEELGISIGSSLGQLLVKGLNFYQDSRQAWKRALSKAVIKAIKIRGYESTWMRPNKRVSNRAIPIPGKRKLYYPTLGVLIDCSGSMIKYLPSVVGHIANISSSTGGIDYLIGGDIRKTIDYKNVTKAKLKDIEFKGLGGTYLKDMINELVQKNLDILILITDLELGSDDMDTIKNITKKISTILCIPKNYYTDSLITELPKVKIIPISADEES